MRRLSGNQRYCLREQGSKYTLPERGTIKNISNDETTGGEGNSGDELLMFDVMTTGQEESLVDLVNSPARLHSHRVIDKPRAEHEGHGHICPGIL